ncbi:phage tail protein [Acinetobacter pittii]|uniref:phage tail fiber protein n=1 Tax=Acinetobacter pittii TaxID=48296 RepID=UPI001ABF4339|nr:phage tail protein [Acinetobacter pittii]QDB84203.1 phage tail protein [Acinetobacter pittii]
MANLVFKYRWNHGPYPFNSAQGKRQFMLPFASGILNLAPAFSQIHDIPTTNPASRLIGIQSGNVMEVGAYGLGLTATNPVSFKNLTTEEASKVKSGFYSDNDHIGEFIVISGNSGQKLLLGGSPYNNGIPCYQSIGLFEPTRKDFATAPIHTFKTTQNTTIDANGFIKAASPIVKLFAYKIELNDDASKQSLDYEKVGTGDYLLKGSLGFAQEGWYIEVPKDANGNNVVAVEYKALENGDLSIKTYKRKFDFELAAIVADHENPVDIPDGRWIDIRLHEEPEVISDTPINFQPTNLSQAVSAALEGIEPPEVTDENL